MVTIDMRYKSTASGLARDLQYGPANKNHPFRVGLIIYSLVNESDFLHLVSYPAERIEKRFS